MGFNTATVGQAYGKLTVGTTTVTTAGTAVQVTTTSTPIGGIWVAADIGTGIIVVVGNSTVVATSGSAQGIILVPGNSSIFLPINNLDLLHVDSETNGGKLAWAHLQPFFDDTV